MKKSIVLLFLFGVLTFPVISFSQMDVSGNITNNTVWTSSLGPYRVIGDVGVPDGITLTIEPGARIQFTGNYKIQVQGILLAVGTTANKIVLDTGSVQTSIMILFRKTNLSNSKISNVSFNGGANAIQLAQESEFNNDSPKNSGVLIVDSCTFNRSSVQTNGYSTTASLSVSNSQFNYSTIKGVYPRSEPITITNATILNSTIWLDSYNYGINIDNSTVNNCQFKLGCCGANFNITNSTIVNSTMYEGGGSPVAGPVIIANSKIIETPINLQVAGFTISNCILQYVNSSTGATFGNGTVTNTSFVGNGGNTELEITGYNGYNIGGSVNINKSTFTRGSTAIKFSNANTVTIQNSNFINNTPYNIDNRSSKDITATQNYWGSGNNADIAAKIFDGSDNLDYGIVHYSNFLSSPDTTAPMSPPSNFTVKSADSVLSLTWSSNPESDVAGYKIYFSTTSGYPYNKSIDVGNVTSYSLKGLTRGQKYYIAASVYDLGGIESWYSNEVSATPIGHPLTITSFTPTRNAFNVPANTKITMTFNADIISSSATNSTVRINGSLSGLHPCSFSYNQTAHTVTVTPNVQFKVGETVITTVTRGVMNATGDSLSSSYSWSFTVKTNVCTGFFDQSSTVGVGNTPWCLIAADFNHDGAMDLAMVNNYSNDVSILTNNGKGTFTKTSAINVGSYPGSLTTADLDGDGDMDLAVTNSRSNTVSILKNDGNGTFTQSSAVTVTGNPWNVAAVDLDGNGTIDLAVASYSGFISILKNDGNGSFTLTSTVTVGSIACSVTAADVNNDGAIDLVVTNYGSNTISILLNNGYGVFIQTATLNVGNGPVAVAAIDMDGDGTVDLAVVNSLSNTLSILKNNGSGVFTLTSTLNTGSGPTSVIAVDPDGNGIVDLAVANQTANTVSIFKNNGSGSFMQTSTVSTGAGSGPRMVIAADLDGDGCVDFATANLSLNSVSILLNRSMTAPAPPQNLSAAAANAQVTLQWNKNTEADFLRYRIYRSTSPNPATKVDSTTGGITDTLKVFNGLTNGTIYYIRVTAVDSSGWESAYSNEISIKPSLPTGPTIAVADVASPTAGATVLVPINVTDFTNIGAVTLQINYNPATVAFVGSENAYNGISFVVNSGTPGTVKMIWFDITATTPLNIALGKLIDIKFTYIGGASFFIFNPSNCEIANGNGTPITGITYQSGSISHDNVTQFTVSGNVAYANIAATPIGSATVALTPATGVTIATTSSAIGTYSFANVLAGTYTLTAAKTGHWGGVTGSDALIVARHAAGITGAALTGVPLLAADVNKSGSVTAGDALLIVRRAVGLDTSFTAGDWVFSSQSITVASGPVTANVTGLAMGDVNVSYTPSAGTAFAKAVNLSNDAIRDVASVGTFEVPIRMTSEMILGAASLKINYPAEVVTFTGISSKLHDVVSRAEEGSVTIVWADMSAKNAMAFKAKEALVTLKFSPKANKGIVGITLDSWSELSNADGTVISMAKLSAPIVEITNIPTVFSLSQNYPNPFNPSTSLRYGLPSRSSVRLVIYNMLGQVVKDLVNTEQPAGYQSVTWNANVSSGLYFYRLEATSIDDPSRQFVETKKMLLLR